jgi:hypothetical protein
MIVPPVGVKGGTPLKMKKLRHVAEFLEEAP